MFTDKELIIAIPAFVGMFFGLYNFVRDILKNRVNLRIVPKSVVALGIDDHGTTIFKWSPHSFSPEDKAEYFAVEIVNQGSITVTVDSVGFFVKGEDVPLQIFKPIPVDEGAWPRRLEPHEAVTVVGSLADLLASGKCSKLVNAFAETQSGIIRKGSSKALRQLVEYASKA